MLDTTCQNIRVLMNRRVRTVSLIFALAFSLLGLQLANLQVRQANALRNSADNPSTGNVDPFEQNRGDILSSDGVVLAYSTKTNDGHRYLRHYPEGSLFADITGYWDVTAFAAPYGLDAETGQYNHFLEPHTPSITNLQSILTQRSGTDSLVTTVSVHLQKVAQQALGSYTGSVVAIDPATARCWRCTRIRRTTQTNCLNRTQKLPTHITTRSIPTAGHRRSSMALSARLSAGLDVQGHHDGDDLRSRAFAGVDQHPLRVGQSRFLIRTFSSTTSRTSRAVATWREISRSPARPRTRRSASCFGETPVRGGERIRIQQSAADRPAARHRCRFSVSVAVLVRAE